MKRAHVRGIWRLVVGSLLCVLGGCGGTAQTLRASDAAYVGTGAGIVEINLQLHSVVSTIRAAGVSFAITPNGRTAYVPSKGGWAPLDLATGTLGLSIPHTGEWSCITMAPDGRTFYLSGFKNGTGRGAAEVIPVSTRTNVAETAIEVDQTPVGCLSIDSSGTAYPITGEGSDITPLHLTSGATGRPIAIAGGVLDLSVTRDGNRAYAIGATTVGSSGVNLVVVNLTSGTVGGHPTAPSAERYRCRSQRSTAYLTYSDHLKSILTLKREADLVDEVASANLDNQLAVRGPANRELSPKNASRQARRSILERQSLKSPSCACP